MESVSSGADLLVYLFIFAVGFALGTLFLYLSKLKPLLLKLSQAEKTIEQGSSGSMDLVTEHQNLTLRYRELEVQLVERNQHLQGLKEQLQALQIEHGDLGQESMQYREQLAAVKMQLSEQQKQMAEKLTLLQDAKAELNTEFKNMANEIFEDKQKRFRQQSQDQLDGLLKPLGERIQAFEKRVEESYSQEAKERFSLIKEVKSLQDLNARISEDAVNLTNALKGESKTQGTWGEVILERVLEKSGLMKGREYEVQVAAKSEEGKRLQPDVVVHLPEGKDLVIDAKVSLTAYERFCSSSDPATRQAELNSHIQSLRQHIKQLSAKDYQNLEAIRTLDFVLLFVPVEAAFSVAVQEDPELFSSAFDRNIVLVAPSTLLATLRTIQNIWRYEQQNKNAQEIANRAGALYDKFVNFVSDLEDIGQRVDAVQTAYDKAHNKLVSGRGSLVSRAETMRELGAKVSKSLPQGLLDKNLSEKSLPEKNLSEKSLSEKSLPEKSLGEEKLVEMPARAGIKSVD